MRAERDSWIVGMVDQRLFACSTPLPPTLLVPLENPHLHDPDSWARTEPGVTMAPSLAGSCGALSPA